MLATTERPLSGNGTAGARRAHRPRAERRRAPLSRSTARPFPMSLIESELFGHSRARYGRLLDRRGNSRSPGGTLFLDEWRHEPQAQAKVLLALRNMLSNRWAVPPACASTFACSRRRTRSACRNPRLRFERPYLD